MRKTNNLKKATSKYNDVIKSEYYGRPGFARICLHFDSANADIFFKTTCRNRDLIYGILNKEFDVDFGEHITFQFSNFKIVKPFEVLNGFDMELVLSRTLNGSVMMSIIGRKSKHDKHQKLIGVMRVEYKDAESKLVS